MTRYLALAGRALIGMVFLNIALFRMYNFETLLRGSALQSVPFPSFVLGLSIAMVLLGGLSLIMGYKTQIGAAVLALYLIPATLLFRTDFSQENERRRFRSSVVMIGACLVLARFGAGELSVDEAETLRQAALRQAAAEPPSPRHRPLEHAGRHLSGA